jgi:hypothetical protein
MGQKAALSGRHQHVKRQHIQSDPRASSDTPEATPISISRNGYGRHVDVLYMRRTLTVLYAAADRDNVAIAVLM